MVVRWIRRGYGGTTERTPGELRSWMLADTQTDLAMAGTLSTGSLNQGSVSIEVRHGSFEPVWLHNINCHVVNG
jgi:hypothetical protein